MFWIAVAAIAVGFLWYSVKTREQESLGNGAAGSLPARANQIHQLHRQGQRLGAAGNAEGLRDLFHRQLAYGQTDDATVVLDGYWGARKVTPHAAVVMEIGFMLRAGEVNHAALAIAGMFASINAIETGASEEVLAARIGVRYPDDRRPPTDDVIGELVDEERHLPLDDLVAKAADASSGLIRSLRALNDAFGSDAEGPVLHQAFAAAADAAIAVAVTAASLGRWIADRHPSEVAGDDVPDSELIDLLRKRTRIADLV